MRKFWRFPLQQLCQALNDPACLFSADHGAFAGNRSVKAQEHAFFGGAACVVDRLRLFHQVAGQVFAQLVARDDLGNRCLQHPGAAAEQVGKALGG